MSDSHTIRFKSKRNKVLLNRGIVEKYHMSAEAAAFEAARLRRLHKNGVAVPGLISLKDNLIKMEYIDGITLPDLIDVWESAALNLEDVNEAIENVAKSAIEWMADFYNAIGQAGRGDINGRNFIYDGKKIWGIDFEDQAIEAVETDIGRLMAYILTYHPPNTHLKKQLSDSILNHAEIILKVDPKAVLQRSREEIDILLHRRKGRIIE